MGQGLGDPWTGLLDLHPSTAVGAQAWVLADPNARPRHRAEPHLRIDVQALEQVSQMAEEFEGTSSAVFFSAAMP